MTTQDTLGVKEKIISILQRRGPSLPIHIAKETNLSMLFSSAFLSELFSEKKIRISNMKVGNSPLYFLVGQELRIENFSQHLKSKEKDAFILLKQKKFLIDKEQDPAIRVALREIKDFAIPFKKNEEIIWRYFTIPETEFIIPKTVKSTIVEHKQKTPGSLLIDKKRSELNEPIKEEKLNIFDKPSEKKKKEIRKKSTKKKQNDKFFNKIKEFLSKRLIEILDIESFNKNDLIIRIKNKDEEKLLIAYNKKRINESDIIKAHKKALESNLKYIILSLGEPLKKLTNLIEALKNLEKIEKITD